MTSASTRLSPMRRRTRSIRAEWSIVVEARRDVRLEHPLVVALGSRSGGSRRSRPERDARAEAVGTRLEVRLEDRLQHQLQRGLHDPVASRSGSPAAAACPLAGLGISAPAPAAGRTRRTSAAPKLAQERRDAESSAMRAGTPGRRRRCAPPCCPAPAPTRPRGTPGRWTRLYRSSNRRPGSAAAHRCSLVCIRVPVRRPHRGPATAPGIHQRLRPLQFLDHVNPLGRAG